MTVARFVSEREAGWARLDDLARRAAGHPERLGAAGVRELGAAYRAAAADLALARRAYPGDAVVLRLERLVAGARGAVYARTGERRGVRRALGHDVWAAVGDLRWWLVLAAVSLFVPAIATAVWGAANPGDAAALVPGQFIDGAAPPEGGRATGADSAAFSATVLSNNVRVTLTAFAIGAVGTVGGPILLGYNGVILGAVFGVAAANGNALALADLIVAHGVIELSCIVVGGAAGMRLGWALVSPGRRTRAEALQRVGRTTVAAVVAAALGLVLAGLAEGFVSTAGAPRWVVWSVGLTLGAGFVGLAVWRTRAGAGAPGDLDDGPVAGGLAARQVEI